MKSYISQISLAYSFIVLSDEKYAEFAELLSCLTAKSYLFL